jgi:hypothetical protein
MMLLTNYFFRHALAFYNSTISYLLRHDHAPQEHSSPGGPINHLQLFVTRQGNTPAIGRLTHANCKWGQRQEGCFERSLGPV